MKKAILIIFCLILVNKVFAKDSFYTKITKNSYQNNEITNKQSILINFNEDGYITKYTCIDNEINTNNSIKLSCNTELTEHKFIVNFEKLQDNKTKTYSKEYIFNENKWIALNNKNNFMTYIKTNKLESTVSNNSQYIHFFEIKKAMLILGISRTVFNYNLEKGIILDLINLQYANSNAQDYQDSYQNLYSYKDGKYYFSQYYDNYKDTYEIETNYNFISWKASAANFCLTDISDPVIIPFILGFGNGFEFQEGVDYSGDTEEPVKKR